MRKFLINNSSFLITLLLLLAAGSEAWAVDYSGTYYIANAGGYTNVTGNNYYMVPAANPQKANRWDAYYSANYSLANGDPERPFITTYKTSRDNNSLWQVISSGDGYYYFKHWLTGKYLIYEPPHSDLPNRKSVHLQATATPGDNAKFDIQVSGSGVSVRPISVTSGNCFLNPAGNNADNYYGSGGTYDWNGLVGIWSGNGGNSIWYLNEAIAPPTITVNASGLVTMTSAEGTTVYYTTDGTTPTTSSTAYTGAITPTAGMTAIKAIAVRTSDSKVSNAVSLPLQTYTYYIINRSGNVAIKKEVTQSVGKSLTTVDDIPADIRSSYLAGETPSFYTFTGAYTTADQLTDEVKITATPGADANIYVTYTTDLLSEKFLHLRGARAFNIKVGDNYAYDNSGAIAYDSGVGTLSQASHLWNISGNDPYDVQIKNMGTDKRYLVFSTPATLSVAATATPKFILMAGSADGDGSTYEQVKLMAVTGTGSNDFSKAEIRAYPYSISTTYHLIDKAGKLIADIPSSSAELAVPSEWTSPLVSEYHYYSTASVDGGVYTLSNTITSPFDVGDGGNIYVNYDVSDAIDLEGTKTYMMRFSDGENFNQENGSDGIYDTQTKAVYPYNNGDFNLYVYGQEQWENQLSSGASTRTRWLWYIKSRHNGVDLTGDDVDPYHVVIKSYQNHTVKDKEKVNGEQTKTDVNYGTGSSYLQTYKPSDYASVVTNIAYENVAYHDAYSSKMPTSMVNGEPTEYMILGTSMLNMTLKTFYEVDGERRTVNSFEQYWKNNPTVKNLVGGDDVPVADNTTLTEKGWHRFTSWAYSAPWGGGSKTLHEETHWYQTISMGSGQFTLEEVSLTPQAILLDQHGWEVMRVPMYTDAALTVVNTEELSKFNSPMVAEYQWYPKAEKYTGYHKYRVSDPDIVIYELNEKNKWVDNGRRTTHNSTSLADIPYLHIDNPVQDKSVKTDFYVTYTVKPRYTSTYTGAATADATQPSAYLLKQGGSYAQISGSNIVQGEAPASMDNVHENIQWYLRPNFDIDREMGYRYAGESGAQAGAKSKNETEQDYYDDGKNGFDPYNVQIQSVYNQNRYFTANTTSPALSGGTWTGTSSQVTLQNLSAKQTATGYDQTTLNITNATFMVVDDGNGNMRLMPRFDHTKVATISGSNPFASLAAQTTATTAGDTGTGSQTLWLELIPKATEIHSSAEMTEMNGHYLLAEDFTFTSGFTSLGTSSAPFTGVIDGQYNTFSGLTTPLVAYADGAKICNLILDNVSISGGTNVGAICNEASGDTRIYNCGILATNSTVRIDNSGYTHISSCSSTVSGSNYVGGLVGLLDGSARVINCFSYADITGGATVGGIVGYNNIATTSSNLKTMVMNCMFYGDITGGTTSKAPIYNGKIITNRGDESGVGNYNYFYGDASYVQPTGVNYNCALLAETRFLQRFEFFRHLLNSHRELAAWWATGDYSDKEEMAKWVLLPSQIGSSTPYPVLAKPGYYPSVVNIDADNAPTYTERNKGGNMGTLSVTIQMGDGAQFTRPTGAEIVYPSLTLNITDKDPDHFNFNYYKVQLPYYNDVGTKNYTGNRVVTGWKIVSITGGTPGTFSTSTADAPSFNFADRQCTNKDLYSTSGRVFNQGAYWDVPEGVTAITIEPYWAKAAYLADANADVVYNKDMGTAYNVPNVGGGTVYTNESSYPIAGDSQVVYTTSDKAITALGLDSSHKVYDYAIVLVGNYHYHNGVTSGDASKPYTIMSADFDNDNEPDYSYILRFNGRTGTHPVRVDFLNIPGLGMAQKSTSGTGSYNFGIMQPKGWFEATNTSLFRVTQFEYDASGHGAAPYIVHGGVMEQWVSAQADNTPNNITYYHVGSNVWFKEFHRGVHQDNKASSKHPPISVTGGDFDEFYLTGLYRADITKYDDNAECYINGGRFGVVAGTGMEGIGNNSNGTGNITWQIQNADIREFYGGGINADKIAEGNITTTITGGKIDLFCGGPKFGDMNPGKTVVTTATGCEFGSFFGAGYGGNSYSRRAPKNYSTNLVNMTNPTWNGWVKEQYKLASEGTDFPGISTQFSYQFIPLSGNVTNVARLFVEHVKFSLATTHNVTSTLTDCVINGNFYGGGSLGKVDGPATSTLTNCDVRGNVYGAGYSAALPTVEVDSIGFRVEPYYYESLGTYRTGVKGETTTYTWEHGDAIDIDKTNHILYTPEDLTHLGTVTGNATLTINGTTTVAGSVYGGGEMSNVTGDTKVSLLGGTINNNVYGGGRGTLETDGDGNVTGGVAATVGGATVELNKDVEDDAKGCVVKGSIFGCNNLNGTPLGDVTVHIYKTQNEAATRITNPTEGDKTAKVKGRYDVKAVYGGGNLAKYEPADLENNKTEVIIDGCERTSIEQVYGGGNAASVPATSVTVNGTYEIDEVFGGGNGKDDIMINGIVKTNPGANVGFYDYSAVENNEDMDTKEERRESTYKYGSGMAEVNIYGGTIHKVFGGSNTKGNVRQTAVTTLDEAEGGCAFCVDEAYGGGKSAPMDAVAELRIGCIPGMKAVYGGAEAADMNGDVTLNITNGTYERVFGGNNISGTINGAIKVNIEETGCQPIIIGELYGGGNEAAYSVYGYNDDGTIKQSGDAPLYANPQVNVKSFTSIGNIYGGGFGETAVMVGNPVVNINEVAGTPTNYPTTGDYNDTGFKGKDMTIEEVDEETGDVVATHTVNLPAHVRGKIGAIGNVFGGGNAAKVIGNTQVNIGTLDAIDFVTKASGEETPRTGVTVVGANITGNVYGGGNNAEVTGDTNVNIGRKNP
ncbi:MAG: chitobiase/beta-hexosaminidase C-terminal domain-containing protein [Prevotella sp.]|nr:chitobiase/beta-hexosaminidase C-terminal domain-containing protein [Prevotella sp.]